MDNELCVEYADIANRIITADYKSAIEYDSSDS